MSEHTANENSNVFQLGTTFASIAGSSICLNGKEKFRKIEIKTIKEKIKNYLKANDRVRISELAEILNIPPRMVGQVLNELEDEGIIKEVE